MSDQEEVKPSKYPKWKYRKDWTPEECHKQKSPTMVMVKSEAHEKKLGAEFKDSPKEHGIITHPYESDYEDPHAEPEEKPKGKAQKG